LGFLIFVAYPILASLYFSFTQYNVLTAPKWIGFANYGQLFHSHIFWQSLLVTLHYTVLALPLSLLVGLLVATLLNGRVRGMRVFRTVYYLPTLVPPVAGALLWTWLLNPQFGLINYALYWAFHIQGPAWLTSRTWVIPAIVLMSLWGFGGNMIIYLAAMQGIPEEYYDAAAIDGAGQVRKFVSMTIPLITPAIFFTLVLGLIGAFQVFSQVYVLTQGGPDYASYFYNLYLYQNAFQFFKMGLASAQAWILFLIILGCTLLLFRSSGGWVNYDR
jgi:multiple sugar transport system permease protein